MALDLPLPKKLFVHGHWLADGVKVSTVATIERFGACGFLLQMSKSKGNVVDPFSESTIVTTEGLRYFILRQGVPHDDVSK